MFEWFKKVWNSLFAPKTGAVVPAPIPAPKIPDAQVAPIKGWFKEYDLYIGNRILGAYPSLLTIATSRISSFDPAFFSRTRSQSEMIVWWQAFLYAVAMPESSHNRCLVYTETTMDIDPITKYQVRSEGLFQLSYQDVPNYKYKGNISWEKDKALAKADYDARRKDGNPSRTILDAYNNIDMALFIMNTHLTKFYPSWNFQDALGKYWYVMQSKRTGPFGEVKKNLAIRKSQLGI